MCVGADDQPPQEPVDREVRPTKTTRWSLENQLPRWHLQCPEDILPEAPPSPNCTTLRTKLVMTWGGRPDPHHHHIHSTMESYINMAVRDSSLSWLTCDRFHNGLACIALQNHLALTASSVITLADLKAQRGRFTFQESSAVWWPCGSPSPALPGPAEGHFTGSH